MLKQTTLRNPSFRLKKCSVGRMLIAIYVLVVLGLSATAKAESNVIVSCFKTSVQNF